MKHSIRAPLSGSDGYMTVALSFPTEEKHLPKFTQQTRGDPGAEPDALTLSPSPGAGGSQCSLPLMDSWAPWWPQEEKVAVHYGVCPPKGCGGVGREALAWIGEQV